MDLENKTPGELHAIEWMECFMESPAVIQRMIPESWGMVSYNLISRHDSMCHKPDTTQFNI